jgi:hypothetical protein
VFRKLNSSSFANGSCSCRSALYPSGNSCPKHRATWHKILLTIIRETHSKDSSSSTHHSPVKPAFLLSSHSEACNVEHTANGKYSPWKLAIGLKKLTMFDIVPRLIVRLRRLPFLCRSSSLSSPGGCQPGPRPFPSSKLLQRLLLQRLAGHELGSEA